MDYLLDMWKVMGVCFYGISIHEFSYSSIIFELFDPS